MKLASSFVRLSMKCAVSAVALTASGHAMAQDGAASDRGGLEEIVVTAQKRSESAQRTPLSITAISSARLEAANITQVEDLHRVDPALQIGHSSGAIQTFVRGIGNPVTTAGNEASVPIYIDDVYYIRATPAYFDLANVERVEVLKGPQGTLFGRNASGGVVSIYTRNPEGATLVKGKLGYGNFETLSGQFYAGGQLADTVAADISVSGAHQGKGWGTDLTTGEDVFKQKYISLRSKWIWRPTDTTSLKLIGYYANSKGGVGILQRPVPGTTFGSPPLASSYGFGDPGYPATQATTVPGFYDTVNNAPQILKTEGYGGSVRFDQELSFADLVSITAFRRSKEFYQSDGDFSAYDLSRYHLSIVDRQLSQELQIKSRAGSRLAWILGGYFLKATQGFNPTKIFGEGPAASGLSDISIFGLQYVRSYAAFGQATYPVTDTTNLTVGLRYTIDKVRGVGRTDLTFFPGVFGPDAVTITDQLFDANNACSNILANTFFGAPLVGTCNAPNADHTKTFKKWTWKAAIDQKLAEDVMAYASYSRGFKTGTFNTLPLQDPALKPEVVDAYELGVKSELFDNRLRLNVALFWNDITDPQVQTSSLGVVKLLNAGRARTRGVEFDSELVISRGLNARLSMAFLDAEFRDFTNAPFFYYISPGVLSVTTRDATGNDMPFASKFKLSGGLSYSTDLDGVGKLQADFSGSYSSPFNWDADNVIKERRRILLDAALAFSPVSLDNLTFRVWMKNITNRKYTTAYLPQATSSAYSSAPGAPRTFGVEVGFEF